MAENQGKQEKKLIIDEDWKKEAQREKEVLAAQEEKEAAEKGKAGQRDESIPRGDLAALLSMLTTQALLSLGILQIKGQERKAPDLELARYYIDMLEALETKTKGNLTSEEDKALKSTLSELRMGYVQMAGGGMPSE